MTKIKSVCVLDMMWKVEAQYCMKIYQNNFTNC